MCAGPCVINVYINYERKFAFVELRTGGVESTMYIQLLLTQVLLLYHGTGMSSLRRLVLRFMS